MAGWDVPMSAPKAGPSACGIQVQLPRGRWTRQSRRHSEPLPCWRRVSEHTCRMYSLADIPIVWRQREPDAEDFPSDVDALRALSRHDNPRRKRDRDRTRDNDEPLHRYIKCDQDRTRSDDETLYRCDLCY